VRHVETNGTENGLDALPGLNHGVNAAESAAPPRQGDVDGFGCQPPVEFCLLQLGPPRAQQALDLLLELVDARALFPLALGLERSQPLEHGSERTLLAQEAGLGIFKCRGVVRLCELFFRLSDQIVDLRCHSVPFQMQTEPHGAPFAIKQSTRWIRLPELPWPAQPPQQSRPCR